MVPEKILVIEDDPDVRDTVVVTLECLFPKAKITALESGLHFMEVFQQEKIWIWDLVILDVMLPKMSGVEVCGRIRQIPTSRGVPILAMSGYDTLEMEEKIIKAGANQYLAKPFEINDLKKVVREMIQ